MRDKEGGNSPGVSLRWALLGAGSGLALALAVAALVLTVGAGWEANRWADLIIALSFIPVLVGAFVGFRMGQLLRLLAKDDLSQEIPRGPPRPLEQGPEAERGEEGQSTGGRPR